MDSSLAVRRAIMKTIAFILISAAAFAQTDTPIASMSTTLKPYAVNSLRQFILTQVGNLSAAGAPLPPTSITLNGAIDNATTSITVADASQVVVGDAFLATCTAVAANDCQAGSTPGQAFSGAIKVTAITGNVLTVVRGYMGGVETSHLDKEVWSHLKYSGIPDLERKNWMALVQGIIRQYPPAAGTIATQKAAKATADAAIEDAIAKAVQ